VYNITERALISRLYVHQSGTHAPEELCLLLLVYIRYACIVHRSLGVQYPVCSIFLLAYRGFADVYTFRTMYKR
jgi:hypothetical protein